MVSSGECGYRLYLPLAERDYWATNETELAQELALHMRDDNPLMIGTDYNPKALKSIFHNFTLIGPDFDIYFLDSQGNITTHAAPEGTVLANQIDLSTD